MYINYYKTYIQTIKNAVGTKMFQEFYITQEDGTTKDILKKGEVACAYFVSNILKQFNLTPVGRANVEKVVGDLEQKGWIHLAIDTPSNGIPVGSILVWEAHHGDTYQKMHYHIGFYMGDEEAISNNSNGFESIDGNDFVPVRHHRTYNGTRKLTHIFSRDWNNPFAEWLYHYELPIRCVQANNEKILQQQGLTDDEIVTRLGKNEGLQNGRLCGPTCILMALAYFGQESTLQEYIPFADTLITYTHAKTAEEKTVHCFEKTPGWYHSGLIYIAQELGKKGGHTISGSLGNFTQDNFLELLYSVLKKNNDGQKTVLITSVTPHFDTQKMPKGGHLVIIAGIDYNGHEIHLIVCDPLENQKKQITLEQFLASCSGKYIIVEK